MQSSKKTEVKKKERWSNIKKRNETGIKGTKQKLHKRKEKKKKEKTNILKRKNNKK